MAEKTISGALYRADKLPATEGIRLLARLTKMLGPALREVEGAFGDEAKGDNGQRDKVAMRAIAAIVAATSEDEMVRLVVESAERAEVKRNGGWEPVVFDHEFQSGGILPAFQVAIFFLEVQFADFFDAGKRSPLAAKIMGAGKPSN